MPLPYFPRAGRKRIPLAFEHSEGYRVYWLQQFVKKRYELGKTW